MPPGKSKNIRIGIVDDHDLIRQALTLLISKEHEVTLEAENGRDMINQLEKDPKKVPDIMFVDINMPVMDGFETVTWLKKNYPDIKIIVLTMYDTAEFIVKLFKLGADSYLTKNIDKSELLIAIKTLSEGSSYYSPAIADKIIQSLRTEPKEGQSQFNNIWDKLSNSEKTLLKLLPTELTYAEMAKELNLSARTVEAMRMGLFEKFNVKTRIGLVMQLVKNGVIKI